MKLIAFFVFGFLAFQGQVLADALLGRVSGLYHGSEGELHKQMAHVNLYAGPKHLPWNVGTVSAELTVGVEKDIDLKALEKEFRKFYPGVTWKSAHSSDTLQMEAEIVDENRTVFLHFFDLPGKGMLMVSSSARTLFSASVMELARGLSRDLVKHFRGETTSYLPVKRSLLDFFISRAHAQTGSGGGGFPGIPGGIPGGAGGIPGLPGGIPGLPNLGPLVNGLNNTMSNLNNTMSGIVQEWGETNTILDTVTKKMFDTKFMAMHGAIVGAASAAGAALGGWVTQQALNGAVWALKKLVEALNKKKLRWEDFKTAREHWVKQRKAMLDLERKLDATLNIMAKSADLTPAEALAALNTELAFFQVKAAQVKKELDKAIDQNLDCAPMYQEALNVLETEIDKLKNAFNYYQQDSGIREDRESFFCNLLAQLVSEINTFNYNLNGLRVDLLAGAPEWMRHARKEHKRLKKKVRYINSDWYRGQTSRLGERLIRSIQSTSMSGQRRNKRDFLADCYSGIGPVGQAVREVLGIPTTQLKIRKKCKEAYKIYDVEVASKKAESFNETVADASMSVQAYKGMEKPVYLDGESEQKMVATMADWFSDIREEMNCASNFRDERVFEACKVKFPEIMGPLGGALKAEEIMRQKGCAHRYYEASQGISGDKTLQFVADKLKK